MAVNPAQRLFHSHPGANFEQLARFWSQPPKVIYFRFGNSSLQNIISQLRYYHYAIAAFFLNHEAACLELSQAVFTDLIAE